MKKVKKDESKGIDNFYFWYYLIAFIISLPLIFEVQFDISIFRNAIPAELSSVSLYMILYSSFVLSCVYCAYCLFNTYNKNINDVFKTFLFILNIIDTVLCFSTIIIFGPVCYNLYEASERLYYFVGILFSLFPIITQICYYEVWDNAVIKKIFTRIFMVLITGLVICSLTSCVSGITG